MKPTLATAVLAGSCRREQSVLQVQEQDDSPEMMPIVTYMSTTVRAKEAVTMPVLISTPPAITTKR